MTMDVFIHKSTEFQKAIAGMRRGGGVSKAAADQADAIIGRLRQGVSGADSLGRLTKHGESRIRHCFKYDLAGHFRLVTVQLGDVFWLLTVGTHENVERWLDTHGGLRLVRDKNTERLTPIYELDADAGLPPQDYRAVVDEGRKLLDQLSTEAIQAFHAISTEADRFQKLTVLASNEELLDAISQVVDRSSRQIVRDILLELRAGRVESAEAHLRKAGGQAVPIDEQPSTVSDAIANPVNSDVVINLRDLDDDELSRALGSAAFHDWMLFLHPDQRAVSEVDIDGIALLRGVSGSGKTCVLVHRANYLAKKYPTERILILTLNPALATLLVDLVKNLCSEPVGSRIFVRHVDDMCREILAYFEPQLILPHHGGDYWGDLDANWKSFFQSSEQQNLLRPVVESLEKRSGLDAVRYIRDEFVWVRSAFGDTEAEKQGTSAPGRETYKNPDKAPRRGRAIAFSVDWRQRVLESLAQYERNLDGKGLVDPPGLALRAHRYTRRVINERPMGLNYRCVLVDEIQDLGTVELELVNALSKLAANQLFLTGDPRQQVFPKEHNLRAAGIEVRYRRSFRKNYRNPRQILEAAVAMMQQFDDESGRADDESEPLDPQYSARESPSPVVIQAGTPEQEREHIVRYIEETRKSHDNPICVVACSLRDDDEAGMAKLLADYKRAGLEMSPLGWNSAAQQRAVFLSALETVKGFEFSLVILSECNANVIPNPASPNEEHWRDARRLYVAMTRARDELVMTYTDEPSRFLLGCGETLQWRSVREEGLVHDTKAAPASAENDGKPSPELMEKIEKISAENQQLRARISRPKPDLRVSPKGGMSFYGLGRFPVTLYKDQWLRLLGAENQIRSFIHGNEAKLSVKNKK